MSVEGSESLQIEAIMNNIEPDDMDKNNMSITVTMGCHRVVFLNSFVTAVMVMRVSNNYVLIGK